jgi:hypothetical protein
MAVGQTGSVVVVTAFRRGLSNGSAFQRSNVPQPSAFEVTIRPVSAPCNILRAYGQGPGPALRYDKVLMHGLTLALAVWAVIAPLVGIFLGHYLTRSWQREQWLRDSRKEEFRELLTTLTRSYRTMVLDPNTIRTFWEANGTALNVIRDRIYIAEDLKRHDIFESWLFAVSDFEADKLNGGDKFAEAYSRINAVIVSIAAFAGTDEITPVKNRAGRRKHSRETCRSWKSGDMTAIRRWECDPLR